MKTTALACLKPVFLPFCLAGFLAAAGCGSDGGGEDGSQTRTVNISGEGDFRSVQECIDESQSGDTCRVYPGTYRGAVRFNGKNLTVSSTEGPDVTVLDGDYLNQDGVGDDTVVRFANREGPAATLDGFTITNGAAEESGGGICIEAASPTIRNCIIRDNTAAQNGGGLYCVSSTSRPTIVNTVFEGNTAQGLGGGLAVLYGSPTLINCLLFHNEAERGGAVSAQARAYLTMQNVTAADNTAVEGGGALYLLNASALATNTIVWGNEAAAGLQAYLEAGGTSEAARLFLRYSDLEGGRAGVVGGEVDCGVVPSPSLCLGIDHVLAGDPLFVPLDVELQPGERDPMLGYYLSQPATGREDQIALGTSPAVDTGDPDLTPQELGVDDRATRTDHAPDEVDPDGVPPLYVDQGYHYEIPEVL
ncbi:MAG: right-handed parallel beta-helix repeat-containing protein [bacterium]